MRLGWSRRMAGKVWGDGEMMKVDGMKMMVTAQVIVWISQIDLFCNKFQIYWRQFNETHKNNS